MKHLHSLLVAMLLGAASLAQAGFSISGTRVIYHDAEGEATVQMQRTAGTAPVLLQVWLDDGDPEAKPGAQDLPFILTPAVARVEPERAQVIRIWRIRDDLPTDRESLLFFNALEVPVASETDSQTGANHLRLAMQARMKFFYRPKGLQLDASEAADSLRFSLETSQDGALQLRLHNPTPYHITVPKLALHASADSPALAQLDERALAPMVAPFGELVVPLYAVATSQAGSTTHAALPSPSRHAYVRYTVINDMGGFNAKEGVLSDAP